MVLLRSKCSCCSPADRNGTGFQCSHPTWILPRSYCKGGSVLSCHDCWEIKQSALRVSGFVASLWDDEPKPWGSHSLPHAINGADVIHGDLLLGLTSIGWKANFRSALHVGTQTSGLKLLWKQERNESWVLLMQLSLKRNHLNFCIDLSAKSVLEVPDAY